MDLKRCSNGHFYDGDSFTSCPHCEGSGVPSPNTAGAVRLQDLEDVATERFAEPAVGNLEVKSPAAQRETIDLETLVNAGKDNSSNATADEDDQNTTVSYYKSVIGAEPIVGWLVCVEGNHFGEDFRLRAGKNFIGRSSKMDVCLSGDPSVSREKHAIVLYDPNHNIVLAQSGDSKELSYHNDNLVLSPVELHPYDLLKVGATKLMFIPFCSDKFSWKSLEKQDDEKE